MVAELIADKKVWDEFVDASPNGTLFHRWELLQIISRHTGYKLQCYGIYERDELTGIIPFFLFRKGPIKHASSPTPILRTNMLYAGFAMSSSFSSLAQCEKEERMERMVSDIDRALKSQKVNNTSIGLTPGYVDVRPFYDNGYDLDLVYTYIIDLDRPIEQVWEGFDRDCKKNIRETAKNELFMKETRDVETFFDVMNQCLQGQGANFYNLSTPQYIRDLMDAFPESIKMYFMYNGEDRIGIKANIIYKDHYISWMGNVTPQRNISANEFFYWEFIKYAKAHGCRQFENFGTEARRLNDFKSKFNPTLVPCLYVERKDTIFKALEFGLNGLKSLSKLRP